MKTEFAELFYVFLYKSALQIIDFETKGILERTVCMGCKLDLLLTA